MRKLLVLIFAVPLLNCTGTTSYDWQDARQVGREGSAADLDACRDYAARQYRPGIPAGVPYLQEQPGALMERVQTTPGTWRPDRAPFHDTNINQRPLHNIPVQYTGFPGYLDYYPGYLDAILEKCMKDRGWSYEETAELILPGEKNPHQ